MAFESNERVILVDHPLVQHKLSVLRAKDTPPVMFRQLVCELSYIEGCEVTRELPLVSVDVETPLAVTECQRLATKPVIVPIIRAGIGLVNGMLELIPTAKVGYLGMERDEVTHEPREYYAKMPEGVENAPVIIVDPMLATGGSAIAAIKYLRNKGVKDLKLMVLLAAPEGVQAILDADPDIKIYTCAIDDHLNENAYIVPGLGDAGDRIFGTL